MDYLRTNCSARLRRHPALAMFSAMASAFVLSSIYRAWVPINPIVHAVFDDQLQVRLANSLENDQWLGSWDILTLAKGPGYPFLLASIQWTGLSPTLVTHAIYLIGCTVLSVALWRWRERVVLPAVLFVVMAFDPVMFGYSASRIYRESLMPGLAVLALGLVVSLALLVSRRSATASWLSLFMLDGLALAATVAWMSITRADSIWVILTLIIAVVLIGYLGASTAVEIARRTALILTAALVVMVCQIAVNHAISRQNLDRYGVYLVDDFSAGAFASAIERWGSVKAGDARKSIAVSEAQRRAVYAISPTARSLEPYLELPSGAVWRMEACLRSICDDYAGWFPWALREAAWSSARITTAPEFQALFARIDRDIEDACASGELICGAKSPSPGVQSLAKISLAEVFSNLAIGARSLLEFRAATFEREPHSELMKSNLELWRATVNHVPWWPAGEYTRQTIPTRGSTTRVVQRLYSIAAWIGFAPALLGLVWGWFRPGGSRFVSGVGMAALLGAFGHVLMLSMYAAGSGAYLGEEVYMLASQAFLTVGLVCGLGNLSRKDG